MFPNEKKLVRWFIVCSFPASILIFWMGMRYQEVNDQPQLEMCAQLIQRADTLIDRAARASPFAVICAGDTSPRYLSVGDSFSCEHGGVLFNSRDTGMGFYLCHSEDRAHQMCRVHGVAVEKSHIMYFSEECVMQDQANDDEDDGERCLNGANEEPAWSLPTDEPIPELAMSF